MAYEIVTDSASNLTRDLLEEYEVPILMDLDIGHQFPQMPIISGAYAHVTAEGNKIRIDFALK